MNNKSSESSFYRGYKFTLSPTNPLNNYWISTLEKPTKQGFQKFSALIKLGKNQAIAESKETIDMWIKFDSNQLTN